MKSLVVIPLLLSCLALKCGSGIPLSAPGIAKKIHKGAYNSVKGVVNGLTEVVGTPVDIKEVKFYHHSNINGGSNINSLLDPFKPEELKSSKSKIYFLIHGWTQSREKTPWFEPVTKFLLQRNPDGHVVQIDWEKPASDNYASAAFSTESVGELIGNLVYKLVKEYNVPRKNIVIIGHSLGGQISGWVGKTFFKLTQTKLPRIVALDPAGPLFSVKPSDKRLNKNDAEVVMVLHTDGSKLGFGDACGTIDFFPNGGSDQPGCYKVDLGDLSTLTEPIWCDHRRAYELFVEALKSPDSFIANKCRNYDEFKSVKCENVQVSLGDLETTQTGLYYLETSKDIPRLSKNDTKSKDEKETERNKSQLISESDKNIQSGENNEGNNSEDVSSGNYGKSKTTYNNDEHGKTTGQNKGSTNTNEQNSDGTVNQSNTQRHQEGFDRESKREESYHGKMDKVSSQSNTKTQNNYGSGKTNQDRGTYESYHPQNKGDLQQTHDRQYNKEESGIKNVHNSKSDDYQSSSISDGNKHITDKAHLLSNERNDDKYNLDRRSDNLKKNDNKNNFFAESSKGSHS